MSLALVVTLTNAIPAGIDAGKSSPAVSLKPRVYLASAGTFRM